MLYKIYNANTNKWFKGYPSNYEWVEDEDKAHIFKHKENVTQFLREFNVIPSDLIVCGFELTMVATKNASMVKEKGMNYA